MGLEPKNKVAVLNSQVGGLPRHGGAIADAEHDKLRIYSKASQEIGWLLTERMWVATHVHSWLRIVESIRTAIIKNPGGIYIPDLCSKLYPTP